MAVERLNLSSLRDVGSFAGRFAEISDRCDLLVNNAGVMMVPDLR